MVKAEPQTAAPPVGRRVAHAAGALLCLVLLLRPFYGALMYAGVHEWLVSCMLVAGGLATAAVALGSGTRVPRAATGAMGVWVLWAFASIAWSIDRGTTVRQSFALAALASVWWTAVQVGSNARWRRAGLAVLALGLAGSCARALYQYFFLFKRLRLETFEQMTEWSGFVAADRLFSNRVFAWFVSPTAFGDYLAVLVPLVVAVAIGRWYAPRRGAALLLTVAGAGLAAVGLWCLALTTARGAWLATAVALLVLVAWQTGRWVMRARAAMPMLLLGVVFAATVPTHAQDGVPPPRPLAEPAADEPLDFVAGMDPAYFDGGLPSFEQLLGGHTLRMRASYWRGTWGMVRDRPLLGVGWGAWGAAYPRYTVRGGWPTQFAHNNYFQVFAELGPVGFVCLLAVLFTAVWGGVRHARLAPTPAARWAWRGATCSVLAFGVHSLTDFALYVPSVSWVAFALFGTLHSDPAGTPRPSAAPRRLPGLLCMLAAVGVLAAWQRVADGTRDVRDARALMHDGQLAMAMPIVLGAMESVPWDGEAAALAGEVVARAAREGYGPGWQTALDAFARAARQQPLSPWVRASYADALWEAGVRRRDRALLEAALRERQAAVANFPVRPDLHARLAETARALGDEVLAVRHAGLAVALEPDYHSPTER